MNSARFLGQMSCLSGPPEVLHVTGPAEWSLGRQWGSAEQASNEADGTPQDHHAE
jgi:hypothetical protein